MPTEVQSLIAKGRFLRLSGTDLRLAPQPHPFEIAHSAAIAEDWVRTKVENPALFDGEVTLFAGLSINPHGVLTGRFHLVRFSTLLYWRKNPDETMGDHLFAHGVPVTGDGKLLAIRMRHDTANPGLVYFAAGSFDRDDITAEGRLDVAGNMAREIGEETGLDLGEGKADADCHLYRGDGFMVLYRLFHFARDAAALDAEVRRHVAGQGEPEIEGPVVIDPSGPRPLRLGRQMPPFLDWFAASRSTR